MIVGLASSSAGRVWLLRLLILELCAWTAFGILQHFVLSLKLLPELRPQGVSPKKVKTAPAPVIGIGAWGGELGGVDLQWARGKAKAGFLRFDCWKASCKFAVSAFA